MAKDFKYSDILEIINQFRDDKSMTDYIHPTKLPDINLYMDQITTFIDENLKNSKRYPTDKILTKTMINNYAKNDLLPAPIKKKYSKEHLMILIFIYYCKSFLSISDIQTLLKPLTDKYFNSETEPNFETIYSDIFNTEMALTDDLFDDIEKKYHFSEHAIPNMPEGDQDLLFMFNYVCSLSYDIFIKKQLVERIIDHMGECYKPEKPEKAEKTAKTDKNVKIVKSAKNN